MVNSCELSMSVETDTMLVETDTMLHEWLSDVLKRSVIVETFGSLISRVTPEFQEERVKTIVIVDFSVSKVHKKPF